MSKRKLKAVMKAAHAVFMAANEELHAAYAKSDSALLKTAEAKFFKAFSEFRSAHEAYIEVQ